ncbi:unnamed protein product, partial [Polarella glacialis]
MATEIGSQRSSHRSRLVPFSMKCILEMAGDVVGAAVLNVENFKAVTKQRREELREVEWAAFEVKMDKLVMQKALEGKYRILLTLATKEYEGEDFQGFKTVDLTSAISM